MSIINRLLEGRSAKSRKTRISYKEAIKTLRAIENSDLRILSVVDNVRRPGSSVSQKCQVPGCGMPIRYEYTVQNKISGEKMIVGSTCVWILLGLSDDEIKDFNKCEDAVKNFYELITWKRDYPQVWQKIVDLKKNNVKFFEPFWEEIKYCALEEEDTKYIYEVNLDKEIEKQKDLDSLGFKPILYGKKVKQISGLDLNDYWTVIKALGQLKNGMKSDDSRLHFIRSIARWSEKNLLSSSQVKSVKRDFNKFYYISKHGMDDNYSKCNEVVEAVYNKLIQGGEIKKNGYYSSVRYAIDDISTEFEVIAVRENIKSLWNAYKAKHGILVK